MTGMALWFTDPLAREVEPTKIPGVTEQMMLATLVEAMVWQFSSNKGINNVPNGRTAVVLWKQLLQECSIGYNRRVDSTVNKLILQSTVLFVCRVVRKDITGVGMPRDKPAGEDVNL